MWAFFTEIVPHTGIFLTGRCFDLSSSIGASRGLSFCFPFNLLNHCRFDLVAVRGGSTCVVSEVASEFCLVVRCLSLSKKGLNSWYLESETYDNPVYLSVFSSFTKGYAVPGTYLLIVLHHLFELGLGGHWKPQDDFVHLCDRAFRYHLRQNFWDIVTI